MMDDRELLEMAAKAAGIAWDHEECGALYLSNPLRGWNPLTDDGDALRLAVQLNLCIAVNYGTVVVDIPHVINSIVEKHNGDPYPATRRAIVRAAAEIGRAE